jgi:hypothetical protein
MTAALWGAERVTWALNGLDETTDYRRRAVEARQAQENAPA